jgi:hypothetical protein
MNHVFHPSPSDRFSQLLHPHDVHTRPDCRERGDVHRLAVIHLGMWRRGEVLTISAPLMVPCARDAQMQSMLIISSIL